MMICLDQGCSYKQLSFEADSEGIKGECWLIWVLAVAGCWCIWVTTCCI